MKNKILSRLPASFPWRGNIHYFDTIDSTNTEAKRMASDGAPHGTVLIADCQTHGRGRMGRSFHSPENAGIYLSMILRPNCPAQQLLHLTCATAVAAADGIYRATSLQTGIKWTNDLVYERKKLGGILTELALNSNGSVDYAIVGIGINCNQTALQFPAEIQSTATSLRLCTGKDIDRTAVIASILVALQEMCSNLQNPAKVLTRYKEKCITIGQEISLVRGDVVSHGKALDVDDNGALLVRFEDGQIHTVNSGEVSIRGMYGYV